jgi:hypothetical protein
MSDGRRIADHESKRRRAFWFRQLYQWHWISSGVCLIGMVLFAATGITLNHAGQIESAPRVETRDLSLPPEMLALLKAQPTTGKSALPIEIRNWVQRELGVNVVGRDTEWSAKDVYVALPRPGGDAWLAIDRSGGELTYEVTRRGWIAYLNDLHKGRHTGTAWSWFLDFFAGAAIIFCLTGLLLLQLHAPRRPSTWPVVSLGFVLPALLIVLFIHA